MLKIPLIIDLILKGVYLEYIWLKNEYTRGYLVTNKYLELSPKQTRKITNKYYEDFVDKQSRKILFNKVVTIQNILDKKIKKFENDTYNDLNRFGDLNLYRYYQFVVAYKKALKKYYEEIILN
tara:strand:+ start:2564 stop:2932 length:369 start_codon:yes stop_codon:yes gene_type:complete